jgi:hypothetical protein
MDVLRPMPVSHSAVYLFGNLNLKASSFQAGGPFIAATWGDYSASTWEPKLE